MRPAAGMRLRSAPKAGPALGSRPQLNRLRSTMLSPFSSPRPSREDGGVRDPLREISCRRVGKGALAPCPPSLSRCGGMVGTLRFAHPTTTSLERARKRERPERSPRKPRKLRRHFPVHIAPERHDQIRDAVEALPAPGIELGRLAVALGAWIDLAVIPGEAQREPFLALAAEMAEPVRRAEIGWEVVREPVGLGEIAGVCHASLLPQFACGGGAKVLARIHAALRHLPFEARQDDLRPIAAKTMADQDAARRVEQRDADVEAILSFKIQDRCSLRQSFRGARSANPEPRNSRVRN